MRDTQTLNLTTIGHLYQGHHQWLVGWLRRRLGCPHHAADLAHDTFARVLVRRDALTCHDDLGGGKALLSTIAHGLMVDHLRRASLERAFLEALSFLSEDQVPSIEDQQVMLETLLEVDAVLRDLPAKVQQAFLLSQIDGLPYSQIATELGVSLSSVQQYMTRAFSACHRARQGMPLQ
ncbi:sigma-70 family RNA polymerase sigma factor [Roseateles chitosanitabidus]|jgi:RNA polymerase sigma-70 factor (ECF subfamily)|uniref:sigma-70 family RNA polymerase sigma factor n=1 Tax=Roseateles chitosanitabidus TaxID=65048 RepID=UPI00082E12A2|nr:sigma-70 family RNA polymerase sigma factor [Roseateles chitosanitabidus]MBO9688204.1 sigma-70 family RNA polymerase sigma factor [Roseateles chitosanitabidus]